MGALERWMIFGGSVGAIAMLAALILQGWKLSTQMKLFAIEHELREAVQQRLAEMAKTLQSAEFLNAQQVVRLENANRFMKGELAERDKVLLEIAKRDPSAMAIRFNAVGASHGVGMHEKTNGARAAAGGYGDQAVLESPAADVGNIPRRGGTGGE